MQHLTRFFKICQVLQPPFIQVYFYRMLKVYIYTVYPKKYGVELFASIANQF